MRISWVGVRYDDDVQFKRNGRRIPNSTLTLPTRRALRRSHQRRCQNGNFQTQASNPNSLSLTIHPFHNKPNDCVSEDKFTAMEITIAPSTFGFSPRARSSYFSNAALLAKIHGPISGTFPAPVTSLLVIPLSSPLGTSIHQFSFLFPLIKIYLACLRVSVMVVDFSKLIRN